MNELNRRRRSLAAIAGAGLVVSTMGVLTAANNAAVSAAPAAPAGDCAVPFPVADLASGDEVNGLTVAQGTTPDPFTGEVLGVLEDGIAPGIDMVIARLESDAINRVQSIWAGMSGSPVYAEDGRLIGAVSYGMSWGPSQVAGITPYEHMDDYVAPSALRKSVQLDGADAKAVAKAAGVSTAAASQGMKRLSVPMTVTGIDPARVKKVAKSSWLRSPRAGGSGTSASVGAEAIVAGGNLGASVAHGLINYSGVGTVTSVCDGAVTGFGHPLAYLGQTTAAMHPASAVYVQEDPAGTASKYANLGAPVGTIDNDRLAAISGVFGPAPAGTTISSEASFGSRSFSGETTATVPEYAADVTWYHLATVNDRAVDAWTTGSSLTSWSIKGRDAQGAPFTLAATDRYRATWDLASEGAGEAPEFVWALSQMRGVTLDSVTADAQLSTDDTQYRVAGVERLVKGRWVAVERRIQAKAGKKLVLRAVLKSSKGTVRLPVSVTVPKRLRGSTQPLWMRGGRSHWGGGSWGSVAGLKEYLAKSVRNDQVVLVLGGSRGDDPLLQKKTGTTDSVVAGQKRLRLVIK